jgi:hypothetical protein
MAAGRTTNCRDRIEDATTAGLDGRAAGGFINSSSGEMLMLNLVRSIFAATCIVAATVAGSSCASAQSAGSFSAAVSNVAIIKTIVCDAGNTSPTDALNCDNTATNFLQLQIKVSNGNSSLLVGGSLQTNILTNTSTTGGNGKQTATATGSVIVTMMVDGNLAPMQCTANCPIGLAYPPMVTYDMRQQTLTTDLGSICNTVGLVVTCTTAESIQLILSTMSAHSFNFVVPGLAGGIHTIQFMIAASTDATASSLSAGAEAQVGVGVGSLTAQVVKTLTPFDSITVGPGGNPTQTFSF